MFSWLQRLLASLFRPLPEPTTTRPTPVDNDTDRDDVPRLTATGIQWIADHESGGPSYYRRYLSRPTWPGGASGVTIGIGFDLGYYSRAEIGDAWRNHLSPALISRLQSVAGLKRSAARARINSLEDIRIPYRAAMDVFERWTLPNFVGRTKQTFSGLERLPIPAQEALVSLVYNRGTSTRGGTRREMLTIQVICRDVREGVRTPEDALGDIASEIRSMKRLWIGRGLDGLLKRRDAEASRVQRSREIQAELASAGVEIRAYA